MAYLYHYQGLPAAHRCGRASDVSVTTPNGTVITHPGSFPGISVVKGGRNHNVWFANCGTLANFVAVLTIDDATPGLPGTR